jgi:hypothetical protein
MDYLGINSPSQLPQLKEVANMEIVFPTEASEAVPEMEQQLAVDAEGNLNTIE